MDNPSRELQHNTTPNITSRHKKITNLAILLWLISLALPAFVGFGSRDSCYGFEVLLIGWLGPVAINVGWFANTIWFFAVISLMGKERSTTTMAGWAVVLSLNTFTWNHTCQPESRYIYGLGLGAVFWLIAIALTFVAETMREKEFTGKTNFLQVSKYYLVGLILLICGLAIHDRVVGNADELYKLNYSLVAFKRSQVCSLSPKPINKIVLNGSIELISSKVNYLINPETLLNLGAPFVRKEGQDYFLVDINNVKTIESKPASAKVSAILTIDDIRNTHSDGNPTFTPQYKVSLVSSEGIVGFEQIVMKQYVAIYCPNIEMLIKQTLLTPVKKL